MIDLFKFQDDHPTKEDKREALKNMPDSQIRELIDQCGTMQGKIFYSSFLKDKNKK